MHPSWQSAPIARAPRPPVQAQHDDKSDDGDDSMSIASGDIEHRPFFLIECPPCAGEDDARVCTPTFALADQIRMPTTSASLLPSATHGLRSS